MFVALLLVAFLKASFFRGSKIHSEINDRAVLLRFFLVRYISVVGDGGGRLIPIITNLTNISQSIINSYTGLSLSKQHDEVDVGRYVNDLTSYWLEDNTKQMLIPNNSSTNIKSCLCTNDVDDLVAWKLSN